MPAPPPLVLSTHSIGKLQSNTFQFSNYGLQSFFSIGSTLYLVIRAQYPTSGVGLGSGDVQVWRSTDKLIWTLVDLPGISGETNQGCSFAVVGSTIYILFQNTTTPATPLFWHRYNLATDAFLTDTAAGPNTGTLGFTSVGNGVTLQNGGNLVVSVQVTPGNLNYYVYTPGSDTWSAGTLISAGGNVQVVAQIHDPLTDLTFVFYMPDNTHLRCFTLTGALVSTDVAVETFPHPIHIGDIGTPTLSGGQVVIPYKFFPIAGAPELHAAQAVIASTPVFSTSTVETSASLPAGYLIQQWDQNSAAPWFAQDIGGTLYVFYAVDNGDLDNASSQCYLYYRTSETVGVWDASQIAFTSVIPGEMIAAYGASVGGFNPVLLVGVVNPVNYPGDGALNHSIIFGAAAVASGTPSGAAGGGGPYVIPRPCKCDIDDLGALAIEAMRQRKQAYPYFWAHPPPGAIRVTAQNSIAVPTVLAGETQGIAYTVDQGYLFALEKLVVQFWASGQVGVANPGDFTWSIDVNKPVGVGALQGMGVQGFSGVDVPLGSLQIPWPLESPDIYSPNDVIRTKFFNVNLLPGSPNFLKTIFLGWRWPVGE